jgi:hypothetical protein
MIGTVSALPIGAKSLSPVPSRSSIVPSSSSSHVGVTD